MTKSAAARLPTTYMSVLPGKVVNMDIRANEIRTQPDDEQSAMLCTAAEPAHAQAQAGW